VLALPLSTVTKRLDGTGSCGGGGNKEKSKSLRVAVEIFHQDDSKGSLQLFDWTHGVSSVTIQRYPMTVLGGKSKPGMKKLKPFVKDSHIVRLVCDEEKHQEELIKELERGEDGQQFFFADPGSSTPLVIVSMDKNLFGSSSLLMKTSETISQAILFSTHGPRIWQQMRPNRQKMDQFLKDWILPSIFKLKTHGVKAEKLSKVKKEDH